MGNPNRMPGSETEGGRSASDAVGIMADSHGDAALIRQAVDLLAAKGCRRLCHLGDVCDSLMPQTAETCLEALCQAGVIAVRGNNDHALAASLRTGAPAAGKTLKLLEDLPMALELSGALFVHSLPFTRELGPASLIGAVGPAAARRFFADFRHPLLFRGHGHSPGILFHSGGRLTEHSIGGGEIFDLAGCLPCIVTCGALASGHCMVWRPAAQIVESLRLG